MKDLQNRPLVSVIMPAYNAARFLEEAVRSVQNQTVADWELLLLEDCSTDETRLLAARLAAEDPRIWLLPNEKNLGVAHTRNRGLALCRGRYVAFLDSDDVWHPEKLEKQLALMEETGADLVYTAYALIGETGEKVRRDYLVPPTVTYRELLGENVIGCSTVLLKAKVLEDRQYDPNFAHEDYALWTRLLLDGCKAVGCTEVLVNWRYRENSRSFHKLQALQNRWLIYRRQLQIPILKSIAYLFLYGISGIRKYMYGRR